MLYWQHMKKRFRFILSTLILAATIAAFAFYITNHPETIEQMKRMPFWTLGALVGLYALWFLAYAFMTRASLRIYEKRMGLQENILFNAYSNLINFFGPGQSGPIFRGAYLKKKHNLGVKQYMFTLLIYFGFYAVISALMMFVGTRPWWQTVIVILLVAGVGAHCIRWYQKRSQIRADAALSMGIIGVIFIATLVQLSIQAVIFGLELRSIQADASINQILAYTGVANFSLFVSLTPGAIGIRESFLLFSQQLHHIDSSVIIAANLIDRATYLVFLGVLFLVVIGLHAKDKLHVEQLDLDKPSKP
jgi:uncharacterized membrane protein YbhN (UPF0104 family)